MNWITWDKHTQVPLDLLLEADPSEKQIAKYLSKSTVFGLGSKEQTIGIICLLPLNDNQLEIMNIAVLKSARNKGIGKKLLEKAFEFTTLQDFSEIIVKTGNSSIDQLAFYQKNGFRMQQIIPDYFSEHYPEQEITENGIACLDQIILIKEIKS
ncbi:GNAT family N-acetyltransferase [Listeria seeligeri]|uniref:GNAT family acetyltransferase n=2 Tax=Listeria seeligeri TaxID=1640 RepID=A0ABR5E999_LISSE|nr:GNAT family N-acetyltransferase [Listeria seeligeri]EFR99414.1 'acetyltransferase, gnat family' [Listeria seeligeri FSL N1-067]KKD46993.1 GNAT family acetyltransferase [Listeria seeligeri]MBC1577470.1 GNAT family N-acetyltransferase [Listeria seeligeri]MBC1593000.1 GNAT family N-acetyltransferase [Listeria seeligeri]MBC1988866.1 GNAT family N-acetyltransferase [Listeria seeligeri]